MSASNRMAQYVDSAPILDAMERWGPDGFSYFHDMIIRFGLIGLLVISGIIEVFILSVSERGFKLSRWFLGCSIALFAFGCFTVWSCWDVWIEARDYSKY